MRVFTLKSPLCCAVGQPDALSYHATSAKEVVRLQAKIEDELKKVKGGRSDTEKK